MKSKMINAFKIDKYCECIYEVCDNDPFGLVNLFVGKTYSVPDDFIKYLKEYKIDVSRLQPEPFLFKKLYEEYKLSLID